MVTAAMKLKDTYSLEGKLLRVLEIGECSKILFNFLLHEDFFVEAATLQRKFPLCQVKVNFPILEVFPET